MRTYIRFSPCKRPNKSENLPFAIPSASFGTLLHYKTNSYDRYVFYLTLSVPDVISGRGDVGLITLVDVYFAKITLCV